MRRKCIHIQKSKRNSKSTRIYFENWASACNSQAANKAINLDFYWSIVYVMNGYGKWPMHLIIWAFFETFGSKLAGHACRLKFIPPQYSNSKHSCFLHANKHKTMIQHHRPLEKKLSLSLSLCIGAAAAIAAAFLKLVRERYHKLYGCLKNVHCSLFIPHRHVCIRKLTEILCYFHYSHCSAALNANSSHNAHAIYWNSVFLTGVMIFITFFVPSQHLASNYHSNYWHRPINYHNHFHNALWKI